MNSRSQRICTIALALTTIAFTAGCHKKQTVAPPPLPASISTPSPTATLTAVPNSIEPGQSSTLSWSTTEASDISISSIGPVKSSGSTTVSPATTTTYTLIARGEGGSQSSTATVTVASGNNNNAAAATDNNLTNDQIFHQQVPDIYYDYDSFDVNGEGQAAATKAVRFLNANPALHILIGGYCDNRGSTEYNQALGASRADAAKQALVRGGVAADRIRTVSYGKEKPFCTTEDEECWHQNRRAAFSVDK